MGLAAKWPARMAWTSGNVEPREEVLGQLAILEALVELPADEPGEPGDFAVARPRGPRERGIVTCGAMVTGMRQD